MIACATSTSFVGYAPAKLNLFFEIHGKRLDGFHDVCSLCCPVSVFDTIVMEPHESPEILFSCIQADIRKTPGDIPAGAENLVVKAVELLRKRYNVPNGCRIRLIKRIPSQAGRGGGSSDAATAIRLACKVWNLRLPLSEILVLGAELGSDVPLFFFNELTLGRSRGELVTPLGPVPRIDFVIVKPPEGISTAEAFRACAGNRIRDHQTPERLLKGLQSGNHREIRAGMFNRLETTARQLCPKIGQLRKIFEQLDCPVHQMTGSGTAYFAI
jgi:4-diphosphocytidyl-2-C-methyl-D-erythritol kinase